MSRSQTQSGCPIETLESRALDELGVDPQTLLDEYGTDRLVPPSLPEPDADPDAAPGDPVPYVRAEQEKRARSAERARSLQSPMSFRLLKRPELFKARRIAPGSPAESLSWLSSAR